MVIVLGKEGYRIRPFSIKDTDALYEVLSDAEVMRYIEPPFSHAQTQDFLQSQGLCERPRIYALADGGDRCVGHVIFHPYDDTSYELGWVIERSHWDRGIASAATAALIEECRACGVRRCVMEHDPKQAVTEHIAKKLGFFAMEPEEGLRRWTFHIDRPEVLAVDERIRLRRFDGIYDYALPWYQDPKTVYLVDGDREPYTPERLARMYEYLNMRGELYFIEALENGAYIPIGDVTFWQEDMPIVIGDETYRGRGIGRMVVSALCARAREIGYKRVFVREIYDWNNASRRCFESVGFRAYEKTNNGSRYVCEL